MSRWAHPTRTTWGAVFIAALVTAGTAGYLAFLYDALPVGLPVRYVRGLPLIYQLKSPLIVMLPAVVQTGLLAVFGALMMLLLWRARPVPASDLASDADSSRMRIAAEAIALLALVWITMQAVGAARLVVLWRGGLGGYGPEYSVAMIAAIGVSGLITARTMRLMARQRQTPPATDASVWKLRTLYFNPRDPALFVPTRQGGGWTLNFGRPLAIILLTLALLVGIGGPYVFARYVLRAFTFD